MQLPSEYMNDLAPLTKIRTDLAIPIWRLLALLAVTPWQWCGVEE